MPKYTVCLTQDVTLSAVYEIEAENPEEAEEKAFEKVSPDDFQEGDWYLDAELSWINNEEGEEV